MHAAKSRLHNLNQLLKYEQGVKFVEDVLADSKEGQRHFKLVLAVNKYKTIPFPARIDYARELCEQFILPDSKYCISASFDKEFVNEVFTKYSEATAEHFKLFEMHSLKILQEKWFPLIQGDILFKKFKEDISKPFQGLRIPNEMELRPLHRMFTSSLLYFLMASNRSEG